MSEFTLPVRIYIEDTDAGGIVYYANYLRYTERARTEWLRTLGISQEQLRQQGILFVVTRAEAQYRKSARLDDELLIPVSVDSIGKARLTINHAIHRINASGEPEPLAQVSVTVACMSPEGRPLPIPKPIRHLMIGDVNDPQEPK